MVSFRSPDRRPGSVGRRHPQHGTVGVVLLVVLVGLAVLTPVVVLAFPLAFPAYPLVLGQTLDSFNASTVALGDVDNDGDLDLALGAMNRPNQLYRNIDGQLTLDPTWVPAARDTRSMAWGDVDNDGDLDLAVGNTAQPNQLYRNMQGNLILDTDWRPDAWNTRSVEWGDVDGDGDLDLAVGNTWQSNQLYRNDGSGQLTLDTTWTPADGGTRDLTWGDADNDGDLDLAHIGNAICIYFNTGGRLGDCAQRQSWGGWAGAWGDMDGDGDLDLAVAAFPSRLYRNNGSGGLTPHGAPLDDGWDVAWGDVDNDNDLDLILGDVSDPSTLYRNIGGTLVADSWRTPRDSTRSVAWGDIDSDGKLDLVFANIQMSSSKVYLNRGALLPRQPVPLGPIAEPLAWGDVDNDGDLDLAARSSTENRVRLYRNTNGTLSVDGDWLPELSDVSSLAWGDADNDGDLDLAVGIYNNLARLYLNDGRGGLALSAWTSTTRWPGTDSVAWGDSDNDADLDLLVTNASGAFPSRVYRNNGVGFFNLNPTTVLSSTGSGAWGDVDLDGDLDLAASIPIISLQLYRNDRGRLAQDTSLVPRRGYTRSVAWGDVDSDGDLDLVVGNTHNPPGNRLYRNNGGYLVHDPTWAPDLTNTYSLAWQDVDGDGDLDLAVGNASPDTAQLYRNERGTLTLDTQWAGFATPIRGPAVWGDVNSDGDPDLLTTSGIFVNRSGNTAHPFNRPPRVRLRQPGTPAANFFATAHIFSNGAVPITYTLTDPEGDPVSAVYASYSLDGGGKWYPALPTPDTVTRTLATSPTGVNHSFTWDVFASGVFGQSDNVIFRLHVLPTLQPRGLPGPYQHAADTATTWPFRVRGTQVRVVQSDGTPASDAQVYRLPAGDTLGGTLISDAAATPFATDELGYLQGRGALASGDQLLALAPISATETYTLYYTNGTPTPLGVEAHTVSASGVQTLTVSAAHPLMLFDLTVALEWDASYDPAYLLDLTTNLRKVSHYLYDFTDGQLALGHITVTQNADEWASADVIVRAANHLRPFAAQGGIVRTPTRDPQHPGILYEPGQVTMGATWNRYGNPGSNLGDDWALTLAHELGHYLLFQEDVYLGLDSQGYLIAVESCTGSAMGDLYTNPANTELIADAAHWEQNCAATLANRTLQRHEWATLNLWYPALRTPTPAVNAGPSLLPFDLTTVAISTPITPTQPLDDPTFYLDYAGGGVASNQAVSYLLREDYALALGRPVGGQNRIQARGAQPGDRLCIFDRVRQQHGCETITMGDDRLTLTHDATWLPVIQVTPQTTTTLSVTVQNLPGGLALRARLYPEFGLGMPPISLNETADGYTGNFILDEPAMVGTLQVWVDEAATATQPRREVLVEYSMGGNPGSRRKSGTALRGGGGSRRKSGGSRRKSGVFQRSAHAPVISPDGQMLFYTADPLLFGEGQLYTLQEMAGLPNVPPGRTVIGAGYGLIASPGAPVISGAIAFEYLGSDVVAAGLQEDALNIYFWNAQQWQRLPTVRNATFNLASAQSQGPGIYALMGSMEIGLRGPGWNMIGYPVAGTRPITEALGSIDGFYTHVQGYDAWTDTWKVYDPALAVTQPWVNDLHELRFGQGYWLHATDTITLYLDNATPPALAAQVDGSATVEEAAFLPPPPTTYYGVVVGDATVALESGIPIIASIHDSVCGQGVTRRVGDELVYSIAVRAASPGATAGCGVLGSPVEFDVGGVRIPTTAVWDNTQVQALPLRLTADPPRRLYLPLLQR